MPRMTKSGVGARSYFVSLDEKDENRVCENAGKANVKVQLPYITGALPYANSSIKYCRLSGRALALPFKRKAHS